MRYILTLIFLILFTSISMAQDDGQDNGANQPEFAMKTYYMVFLNSAPDRPQLDSAKATEIQNGHLANIMQMWKDGKCKLAGPFLDNTSMRGILIMDVASEEEVNELLKNDPAITNGLLVAEIKPWYGPAGLTVSPD